MDDKSANTDEQLKQQLYRIAPEAFRDGKIDWEKLRATFGEKINSNNERYALNWAGKGAAIASIHEPAVKTLVPTVADSINFGSCNNMFIEGENLEVLKLLRKSHAEKVKMIYIDPPYNTGKGSFIYKDRFHESKKEYLQRTASGNNESGPAQQHVNGSENGHYHSNWLNMIYPRLYLGRDLLKSDGVMLIHIDENEVNNLELVCNEIFGEDNKLGTIIWDKGNPKGDAKSIACQHEYIVVYAKSKNDFVSKNKLKRPKKNAKRILNKAAALYNKLGKTGVPADLKTVVKKYGMPETLLHDYKRKVTLEDINKDFYQWMQSQKTFSGGEKAYNKIDGQGNVYRTVSMAWPNKQKAPDEYFTPLVHPITKKKCPIPARGWRYPENTMKKLLDDNLVIFGPDHKKQPERKYLLTENMYENVPSILLFGGSDDKYLGELGIPFENPKPYELAKELISYFTSTDDIIMDFFAGSGTTAHAVLDLNASSPARLFICVQLPEAIKKKTAEFDHIASLSLARIRKSYQRILEGLPDKEKEEFKAQQGVKVFKLHDGW
ncbi:site-specific DNA-methyltransferase [Fulvivirga kasyanovii]|uniref:site-specific DNA-methyltransferase (adenine-specific) n=1 Tax=Fulvivirga kasyanovii TaxID=396812 RepID=A0ABW9RKA5_9BACT|nr:site-specific DNA-methyltransferase [Fulvivirga kasyanovii]MTI24391.1 site-specific DNA-methyltransferase [Fulvivirga kasyanovii]